MRNARFQLDQVTYDVVMEVLGHCGCIEEAEEHGTEMQQAEVDSPRITRINDDTLSGCATTQIVGASQLP